MKYAAGNGGSTPWIRTHGSDFTGQRLPFGCAVKFKPNSTVNVESHKFAGDAIDGVFVGYELDPAHEFLASKRATNKY